MPVPPLTINMEIMAREIDALLGASSTHRRARAVLAAASRDELNMLLEVADERNLSNLVAIVVDEFNRRDEREDPS